MKYKGCTSYLTEDRNEDLLRTFDTIMRRSGSSSIADVYKLLKDAPASRFWVTGERAYEFLVKRKDGKRSFNERTAIYDEIEKRAQAYMKENKVSFRKACKAVVLQPAPSFYLDQRTIENIIRTMRRERWKKKRRLNM